MTQGRLNHWIRGGLLLAALAMLGPAVRADDPPTGAADDRAAMWLPKAVASFGATRLGDHLYVYGGHIGRAHQHSTANLSQVFARHRVDGTGEWEMLPMDVAAQGVQIVGVKGRIFRVGGMVAHNARGAKENLESLSSVHAFDPSSKTWTPVAALPEGRSSHDAIALNDSIYVIGGWTLGGEDGDFLQTALRLDLTEDNPTWKRLATPPFKRRALITATAFGKIFAIGGLTEEGKTSARVDAFDTESGKWIRCPDLPGIGFGAAALGHGDGVYATTMSGILYRLDARLETWKAVNTLALPRFFHRFVARDEHTLLACGGTGRGGHMRSVEPVRVAPGRGVPAITRWSVPNPLGAKPVESVFAASNSLWVFGENAGGTCAAHQIPLGQPSIRQSAPLPARMRGAGMVGVAGDRYAIGGLAGADDSAGVHANVFQYDRRDRAWKKLHAELPAPRADAGVCVYDDEVWVFGGIEGPASNGQAKQEIYRWDGESFSPFEAIDAKLPTGRRCFGGAALNGHYYLVGGLGGDDAPVTHCDVFDFAKQSWTKIPSPAATRVNADLVAVAGRLFLGGGHVITAEGGHAPCTSIEVFDPTKKVWTVFMQSVSMGDGPIRLVASGDRLLAFNTHGERIHLALIDPDAPRTTIAAPATGIRHP